MTRKRPKAQKGKALAKLERQAPAVITQGTGLSLAHRKFCDTYLDNGFNGTKAYQVAYPNAQAGTAATEAWRLLRNQQIREYLNPLLEAAWRPLQMGGEEALARVGRIATIDVRELYDDKGNLLDPHLWPDHFAGVVKSIQDGPYGKKITLESPLAAQRIVLEQSGKMSKSPIGQLGSTLAKLLAGKTEEDEPA